MFNRNDPERSKRGRGANLQVYDLKGAIPFSGDFTAQRPAQNNKHRLRVFRKYLGYDTVPTNLKLLDIGKPNFISRHMGITHNTQGDLNKGINRIIISKIVEAVDYDPRTEDNLIAEKQDIVPAVDGFFDEITSFEVFAHVMNPLLLTQECARLLKKGGKLHLSTPLLWGIAYEHGKGNFTEYKKDRIHTIHQYCGFKPLRYETHSPWMWWFIFYGVRPIARYALNRFQLWTFEKI